MSRMTKYQTITVVDNYYGYRTHTNSFSDEDYTPPSYSNAELFRLVKVMGISFLILILLAFVLSILGRWLGSSHHC